MTMTEKSKNPVLDRAEWNAYFPSDYSLSVYTSPVTDFDGADYTKYTGTKKVLVILSDERYVAMTNGKLFSTGSHPVEALLPMLHLARAGFALDIATLSGNMAKFEIWAMPTEDAAVMDYYRSILPQLNAPQKLGDIIETATGADSPYAAVFIPGGHGVLNKIPESAEVGRILRWAVDSGKFIISLCHGPASLLAAGVGVDADAFPLRGYELCVFPDSLDEGANIDIGYMPGHLPTLVGKSLTARGMKIKNSDITGAVHRDRILLPGDSPRASNALGRLAAAPLHTEVK